MNAAQPEGPELSSRVSLAGRLITARVFSVSGLVASVSREGCEASTWRSLRGRALVVWRKENGACSWDLSMDERVIAVEIMIIIGVWLALSGRDRGSWPEAVLVGRVHHVLVSDVLISILIG